MDVLGTIVAFLAVLVVLVLVHELGHFVAAKRAGITVQEFGIGFPPRITSVVWHGTRYSLNWIPLGGFVKMLGEDGDVEAEKMRERGLSEAAVDKAMEGAFNRKPLWRADGRAAGRRGDELPARRHPLLGRPGHADSPGPWPADRHRDPGRQPGRGNPAGWRQDRFCRWPHVPSIGRPDRVRALARWARGRHWASNAAVRRSR